MQSWEDLGCVSLSISQGLLRNDGKLKSPCVQILGRNLRRQHALLEHSPHAGMSDSPSTAQWCGETARREQSPKPHCCFSHLNSDAFELGRNLYYKVLSSQSPSNFKNVQILCHLDVWFFSLPQLQDVWDSSLFDALWEAWRYALRW